MKTWQRLLRALALWRQLPAPAVICLLLLLLVAACAAGESAPTATSPPAVARRATTAPVTTPAHTSSHGPTSTPTGRPSDTPTSRPSNTPSATPTRAVAAIATYSVFTPIPTRRPPTATRTPPPSATPVTAAALAPALLSPQDLPRGWRPATLDRLDAIEDADEETTVFLCHELPRRRTVDVVADFTRGEFGPQLRHQIAAYPPGAAAAAFADFAAAATACDRLVVGLVGGTTTTLATQPLSLPQLGDETLGVHLVGEPIPLLGRPELNVVKIRSGDFIITIGHFDVGGVARSQTEAFARQALEQFQAALDQ